MTDSLVHILVPYSRFLECQDRRQQIAAELARPDQPPAIDADGKPAPAELASAQALAAHNVEH